MKAVHLIMAILAVWRLTEVVTADKIFERIRNRFPIYLWTCPRCVSVWAGVFVTVCFLYAPFLNWPFALSWLLLLHNHIAVLIQSRMGRRLIVTVQPNNQINIHSEGLA